MEVVLRSWEIRKYPHTVASVETHFTRTNVNYRSNLQSHLTLAARLSKWNDLQPPKLIHVGTEISAAVEANAYWIS